MWKFYSLCHVQLFSTLWTVVCQGSSVSEIPQARILAWVANPFSRESSQPRNRTLMSHVAGRFFTLWTNREALYLNYYPPQNESNIHYYHFTPEGGNFIFNVISQKYMLEIIVSDQNFFFFSNILGIINSLTKKFVLVTPQDERLKPGVKAFNKLILP